MYSVQISNLSEFFGFLNAVDVDFVDFYLNGSSALLISNTSEIFAVCTLKCECGIMEQPAGFRFSREMLRRFVLEGSIDFDVGETVIKAAFRNGAGDEAWSVEFNRQKVFSSIYSYKIDLIKKNVGKLHVTMKDLGVLPKICSSVGGILCVDSGVCGVLIGPGIRVYKNIDSSDAFCITAKNLAILKKCDNSLFAVEDYVGAMNDTFAVLVTRTRQASNEEYSFIAGQDSPYRSQYEAEIDLGRLIQFYKAGKVKDVPAAIDLEQGKCFMVINGSAFEVPVGVYSVRKAAKLDFKELVIPYQVLNSVLLQMSSPRFRVCKKKNFIQFWQDDYVVLFN